MSLLEQAALSLEKRAGAGLAFGGCARDRTRHLHRAVSVIFDSLNFNLSATHGGCDIFPRPAKAEGCAKRRKREGEGGRGANEALLVGVGRGITADGRGCAARLGCSDEMKFRARPKISEYRLDSRLTGSREKES